MSISLCEDCVYYSYDEESDSYYCDEQLDEDEMASFLRGKLTACPFYHRAKATTTSRESNKNRKKGARASVLPFSVSLDQNVMRIWCQTTPPCTDLSVTPSSTKQNFA
mgnify:CR=1 FL=1